MRGWQLVHHLAIFGELHFLPNVNMFVVYIRYARAAFLRSLWKCWNFHMGAFSCNLLQVQNIFKLCTNYRSDIRSDSLHTADFICTYISTAHSAIFPGNGHCIFLIVLQDHSSCNDRPQKNAYSSVWGFYFFVVPCWVAWLCSHQDCPHWI